MPCHRLSNLLNFDLISTTKRAPSYSIGRFSYVEPDSHFCYRFRKLCSIPILSFLSHELLTWSMMRAVSEYIFFESDGILCCMLWNYPLDTHNSHSRTLSL